MLCQVTHICRLFFFSWNTFVVVERLVFCAEQHPRGSCVCFESRSVFPCLTATPGYCSQWLYCVEGVPLNATVCSPGVISTHPPYRRQGGEETCLQMPTHDSMHTHWRVCAKTQTDSYRDSWSWTMTCNSSGCLCHFLCLWEVIWCYCGNQM